MKLPQHRSRHRVGNLQQAYAIVPLNDLTLQIIQTSYNWLGITVTIAVPSRNGDRLIIGAVL
jgi:hypothetical protein